MKQSGVYEAYNRSTRVERTIKSVKDVTSDALTPEAATATLAQVFLAVCLRLSVAITNYERGDHSGSTTITV